MRWSTILFMTTVLLSPAAKASPLDGLASHYGPGFFGHRTASHTVYRRDDQGCAHRTLPLNSRIKVTDPATGRSVECVVDDRGPYHGNRILDLQEAPARQLGMLKAGVIPVKITVLWVPEEVAELPPPAKKDDRHVPLRKSYRRQHKR